MKRVAGLVSWKGSAWIYIVFIIYNGFFFVWDFISHDWFASAIMAFLFLIMLATGILKLYVDKLKRDKAKTDEAALAAQPPF